MIELIFAFLIIVVLMTTHELGHVIAAKFLRLRIITIGFRKNPIPFPYVEVERTLDMRKTTIFYFAGIAVTIVLFAAFSLTNQFWGLKFLYYAFCTQLILETNPFYSDFVIYYLIQKRTYDYKSYLYTPIWYIHFSLWGLLILILLSNRFLPAIIF